VYLSALIVKGNVLHVSWEIVMANKCTKSSHVNISAMSDDDVTISTSALRTISQIFSVFIIAVSFNDSTAGNLKRFVHTYCTLQKSMNVNFTTEKGDHVVQLSLTGPNVSMTVCVAYPLCCP
jgi:hypothetical protein